MKNDTRPKLYICDPEKNTECDKQCCAATSDEWPQCCATTGNKWPHYCTLTTKSEFAKQDENGQPIAATDDDLPF